MSELDRAKLLLKEKYQLVHVPNRHKVDRWVSETRGAMRAGLSPEHAGIQAARAVFPYEYRGQSPATGPPVLHILAAVAPEPDGTARDAGD